MTDNADVVQLHDHPLTASQWWACQHPERPYEFSEVFDERCDLCILKAKADLHNVGDLPMFDVDENRPSKYMLSDLAAGRVPVRPDTGRTEAP